MTDVLTDVTTNATETSEATSAATAAVNSEQNPARSDKVDTEYLQRFERLAKRERDMQSQRQKMQEIETKAGRLERLERLATEDPEAFLEEVGTSYSKITAHLLNKSPQDEATKKLQTLEQRLAAMENEKAEREKQAESQKRDGILQAAKDEIKSVVDASDEYELIRTMNRYDDVMETCIEYFNRTGKYLSFEDAATEVEKVLDEEYAPLLETKRIKSKLSLKTPADDGQSPDAKEGAPTLTNTGMDSAIEGGFVTEKELMRRAIATMKGM
jgi:hypothetical protein